MQWPRPYSRQQKFKVGRYLFESFSYYTFNLDKQLCKVMHFWSFKWAKRLLHQTQAPNPSQCSTTQQLPSEAHIAKNSKLGHRIRHRHPQVTKTAYTRRRWIQPLAYHHPLTTEYQSIILSHVKDWHTRANQDQYQGMHQCNCHSHLRLKLTPSSLDQSIRIQIHLHHHWISSWMTHHIS